MIGDQSVIGRPMDPVKRGLMLSTCVRRTFKEKTKRACQSWGVAVFYLCYLAFLAAMIRWIFL
jgi:hypothetical protein